MMTVKKGRTFAEAKKKYGVNDKVRESSKQYKEMHKNILATLEDGPKNIPQIAEILKMSASDVTYYLMTCRKFGYVKVNGLDDMDEYFLYELEKEK